MWLRLTWTDAFATAASFSRRHSRSFVQQASPLLFRCACSPRLYSPGATSGWSVLLVCLVGLVCLIGLVYLLVCLLVGLLVWLVWCLGSVGLVCLKRSGLEVGLSGWSGLSIAVSVGLLVWVTIVVTHGDLASDSSIKIFAGCWFG